MTELLYGTRDPATVGAAASALDLDSTEELVLADVHIYYCLFETPMAVALARLPPSLHPAIPAHFGITFWRCRAGALGAFEFAFLGVACRAGIKPRHLVYGAYTNSAQTQNFFRARYGYACRLAEVHQSERYDRIVGHIACEGQTLLEVVTTGMQPVVGAGATVKYSPALNPAQTQDGIKLVQLEASFEFTRVLRGTPHASVFMAGALGDARVTPTFPISGTHAIAQIALHPARFLVDPAAPAERGGLGTVRRGGG